MIALEQRLQTILAKQTEHPVYPMLALRAFDERTLESVIDCGAQRFVLPVEEVQKLMDQRERRIAKEWNSKFNLRHVPEAWRRIDLMVARKRLEMPGTVIELFVLGGHDSGKTDGAVLHMVRHHFSTPDAWTWGLHSTQTSSQTIHQERMKEFLPHMVHDMIRDSGSAKRNKRTKIGFVPGHGFTGDQFYVEIPVEGLPDANQELHNGKPVVWCGGQWEAKFFSSQVSNLQGAKLTFANSDELVDKDMAKTVKQRLIPRAGETSKPEHRSLVRDCLAILERGDTLPAWMQGRLYRGVHIMGFTPMEGYSPLVADALDGATTIEDDSTLVIREDMFIGSRGMDSSFIELWRGKELIPGKRVPRFKQPTKPYQLVAYLYTHDNPWTNWPGKVTDCIGQSEEYIRVTVYGDTAKGWSRRFAKFSDVVTTGHVVTRQWVKENIKEGTWYQVIDPHGDRMWFMQWALVDPSGSIYIMRESPQDEDCVPDIGNPGPWAVTSALGKRNGDPGDAQEGRGWGIDRYVQEIKRIEDELSVWWGKPINVVERIIDSRGGQAATLHAGGKSTIYDDLCDRADIHNIVLADGGRLAEGDQAINDRLDFDLSTGRAPRLFVAENCRAHIFTFNNYGNKLKPHDEACEEPRACTIYLCKADPIYMGGNALESYGGGSY